MVCNGEEDSQPFNIFIIESNPQREEVRSYETLSHDVTLCLSFVAIRLSPRFIVVRDSIPFLGLCNLAESFDLWVSLILGFRKDLILLLVAEILLHW